MTVKRKHTCSICGLTFEGVGDHMMQKFASIQAGIDLKAKVDKHKLSVKHQRIESLVIEVAKIEYDVYNKILFEYLDHN